MRTAKVHFFQGADDLWYWHVKAGNGEIVAHGEGYASRRNAHRGFAAAQRALQSIST